MERPVFSEAVLARQYKTLSTHSVWESLEKHLGITGDTLRLGPAPGSAPCPRSKALGSVILPTPRVPRCPLHPSTTTVGAWWQNPAPCDALTTTKVPRLG